MTKSVISWPNLGDKRVNQYQETLDIIRNAIALQPCEVVEDVVMIANKLREMIRSGCEAARLAIALIGAELAAQ